MKAKILLFPLLLLIILSTIIWLIMPAWKNLKNEKEKLAVKEKQLEDIMAKNQLIDSLLIEFKNNPGDRDLVNKFIPQEIGDDVLINSMIHYTNLQPGDNAINVSEISLTASKAPSVSSQASQAPAQGVASSVVGAPGQNLPEIMMAPTNIPIKANDVSVKLRFTSRYEGIKGLFLDLVKLQRAYGLNSFRISRATSAGDGSNALSFESDLGFNFLKEYNAPNVDQSLLGRTFDRETVEAIKKMSAETIGVKVDSQGKNNPFLPSK